MCKSSPKSVSSTTFLALHLRCQGFQQLSTATWHSGCVRAIESIKAVNQSELYLQKIHQPTILGVFVSD